MPLEISAQEATSTSSPADVADEKVFLAASVILGKMYVPI
jgi:hypothetical protein